MVPANGEQYRKRRVGNSAVDSDPGSRARICKHLRRQGIDSEESIPPAYVAWRAGTTSRVIVSARQAGNGLLGSLEDLQIRAQVSISIFEKGTAWFLQIANNIEKVG